MDVNSDLQDQPLKVTNINEEIVGKYEEWRIKQEENMKNIVESLETTEKFLEGQLKNISQKLTNNWSHFVPFTSDWHYAAKLKILLINLFFM